MKKRIIPLILSVILVISMSAYAAAAEKTVALTVCGKSVNAVLTAGELHLAPTSAQWENFSKTATSYDGLLSLTISGVPKSAKTLAICCDTSLFKHRGNRMQVIIENAGSVIISDNLLKNADVKSGELDIVIDLETLEYSARQNGKQLEVFKGGYAAPKIPAFEINFAKTHTVKTGETLKSIAIQHGQSIEILLKRNPQIKNSAKLDVGSVLDVFPQPTDYSKKEHWLNLPANTDKKVDVFYVMPTAWEAKDGEMVSDITSETFPMAKFIFNEQATAFETVGNIYAPYYRQSSAGFLSELTDEQLVNFQGGIPSVDVIEAFHYYITHYNNGRPFILAGHSQGSFTLEFLMANYMKHHPEVYERMIASYQLGYSISKQYIKDNTHLKFAKSAKDTGVIISWNTEMPALLKESAVTSRGGLAINPVTWTRSGKTAPSSQSLGARIPSADGSFKKIMNLADATVNNDRGAVMVSTVDPKNFLAPGGIFPEGVYHTCDYSFFYYDIRQNAKDRAAAYFAGIK